MAGDGKSLRARVQAEAPPGLLVLVMKEDEGIANSGKELGAKESSGIDQFLLCQVYIGTDA